MADYGLVSQALEGLGRSLAGVGEQKARNILAKSEADRSAAQFELTKAQGMGQLELAKSGALLAERSAANEHELKMAELQKKKRDEESITLTDFVAGSNMDPAMKAKVAPFLERVDPDTGLPLGSFVVQRGKAAEMFFKAVEYMQAGGLKRETLDQQRAKAEADRAEKAREADIRDQDRDEARAVQLYGIKTASADRAEARNLTAALGGERNAISREKGADAGKDRFFVKSLGGSTKNPNLYVYDRVTKQTYTGTLSVLSAPGGPLYNSPPTASPPETPVVPSSSKTKAQQAADFAAAQAKGTQAAQKGAPPAANAAPIKPKLPTGTAFNTAEAAVRNNDGRKLGEIYAQATEGVKVGLAKKWGSKPGDPLWEVVQADKKRKR